NVARTVAPPQTYYSEGGPGQIQFADPHCPAGRSVAAKTPHAADWPPGTPATLVAIEGPRFSTRAESRWSAAPGWTIIGMTGHPEAVLARELALCYTSLCLVTDTDAGVEEGEGVTQDEVFWVFAQNVTKLRELVAAIIEDLPEDRACPCGSALDGL